MCYDYKVIIMIIIVKNMVLEIVVEMVIVKLF
jgi:hypothetical protein